MSYHTTDPADKSAQDQYSSAPNVRKRSDNSTTDWQEVERRIVAGLHIRAEYEELGVLFAKDVPSHKGWLACHAAGRSDETASAAVNVGNDAARGRYRDMGGEGLSLNIWEFAAKFGKVRRDWREARRYYAEKAGVTLPSGPEPRRPADMIEFIRHDGTDLLLAAWAEIKGGFELEAIKDNGGRYGNYPKCMKGDKAQSVAAFPGYNGPGWADSTASAWVVASIGGGPLSIWQGKGKTPKAAKTASVGGSVGSLLGEYGLRALADEGLPGCPRVEVVWKAEGLSDMLCLHTKLKQAGLLGRHVVLSNSQGSLESVRAGWIELLRGRTVFVIHDADRPGEVGSIRWCQALHGVASEIRRVVLPYPIKDDHGEDIRDYLHRDGHGLDELLELADSTEVWTPPQSDAPGASASEEGDCRQAQMNSRLGVLDRVGIVALGAYDDRSIAVYSRQHRKIARIANIDHYSIRQLILDAGDAAIENVCDGREAAEGLVAMEEVRRAIAYVAGPTNLNRTPMLGQGLWPSGGKVAVVNGGHGAVYDPADHSLHRVTHPRVGPSTILDFDAGEPWCDFDRLGEHLSRAGDKDWCREAFSRVAGLFAAWNWSHPIDATVAASLVASSLAQTLWPWRPEVAITGPSDCGKSTLLNMLKALLGGLQFYVQKPSEAGLRQGLANSARVILIDEFENDQHRHRVLELFRTTSQGGEVVRGTSDQRGRRFVLRHLPWMAAIESGLTRTADRNRFIVMEMKSLEPGRRGCLELPGEDELRELGLKLLAVTLRHHADAIKLFTRLKGRRVEGVHGRVVENYSLPAALWSAAHGLGPEEAAGVLERFIDGRRTDDGSLVSDEQQLLNAIAGSQVRLGASSRPMGEILNDPDENARKSAEQHGVGRVARDARGRRPRDLERLQMVFVCADVAKRYLLHDTEWAGKDIDQVLLRVDGAERNERKLAGRNCSGVVIPVQAFKLGEPEAPPLLPELPLDPAPPAGGSTSKSAKELLDLFDRLN